MGTSSASSSLKFQPGMEFCVTKIDDLITDYFIVRPDNSVAVGELYRTYVGMVVVAANLLLILFLCSRPSLRRKYFLFTCVAIGDTFDGSYFLFPSLVRLYTMTTGTYTRPASFWDCLLRGNMIFRIFGTEFVGVNMFLLSLERIIAVGLPFFYRTYFKTWTRFAMAGVGLLFCLLNVAVMYVTAYLDDRTTTQADYYCGISGSVVPVFALYHQYLNILTQGSSCVLSFCAYGYALYSKKKLGLDTSKDMAQIRPVLVSSCIACVLIIANNVVYLLKNFSTLGVTKDTQNIVVTWSPAVFQVYKFALYLMTSKEMRMSLKRIVMDETTMVGEVTRFPRGSQNGFQNKNATITAVTVASAASAFNRVTK
ncbi:unnamed protein product, partial [Mesorhabditis spiculigera]